MTTAPEQPAPKSETLVSDAGVIDASDRASAPAEARRKGSFTRSVLLLSTGTTAAQVLLVVSSPILTRLFAPEAFGIAAAFASIVSIMAIVGCLKFDSAILIPKADADAAGLVILSFGTIGVTAVAAALVFGIGGPTVLAWMRAEDLTPYHWFVAPAMMALAAALPLRGWLTRVCEYRRLTTNKMIEAVATIIMTLGAGLIGWRSAGDLIVARIVAQWIVPIPLVLFAWRGLRIAWRQRAQGDRLIALASRYRDFPMMTAGVDLMNTASRQLPAILLVSYFGPLPAGWFALAMRIVGLPGALITGAASQVLYQRAANLHAHGQPVGPMIERLVGALAPLALAPLMLAVAGEPIFRWVFGAEWGQAGRYAGLLSGWLYLMFVVSPLTPLFNALHMQRTNLLLNIGLLVGRVTALVVGGAVLHSAPAALAMFSAVGIVFNLLNLMILAPAAMLGADRLLRPVLAWMMASSPFLAAVALLERTLWASDVVVTFAAGAALLVYGAVVFKRHPQVKSMLMSRGASLKDAP